MSFKPSGSIDLKHSSHTHLVTTIVSRSYVKGIKCIRERSSIVKRSIPAVGVATPNPRVTINLVLQFSRCGCQTVCDSKNEKQKTNSGSAT